MSNSLNINNANIIKYPLITDKATRLLDNNQYSFIVDRYSNKIMIKNKIDFLSTLPIILCIMANFTLFKQSWLKSHKV